MRAIYDAHQAGDEERAREIDAELAPVYEAMTVTANPIPVKAALEMLGVIAGAPAAADGPGRRRAAGGRARRARGAGACCSAAGAA